MGADGENKIGGGGSFVGQPRYFVGILEGIRGRAGEGVRVEYAEGIDPPSAAALLPGPPPVPSSVLAPADSGSEVRGLHAEYWMNTRFEGEPTLVRIDRQGDLNLGFFNYSTFNASSRATPPWLNNAISSRRAMQEAAALAARPAVAVVAVRDYRNEHADLPSLTLSNEQDLLIQVVAAANPRTIVVLATGGPVLMPWLDQVPAVLESWYGGQEQGNALADILFGDVTPSRKIPRTVPRNDPNTTVSGAQT